MLQLLDFILLGIMLVSGLLALSRGFTRELLSLLAWLLAAVAAWYAMRQVALVAIVVPYVDPAKPILAQIVVAISIFILVLITASVIGLKISDRLLYSSHGAFDRTLGLFYGLARGLVLVAICYLFYGWFCRLISRKTGCAKRSPCHLSIGRATTCWIICHAI